MSLSFNTRDFLKVKSQMLQLQDGDVVLIKLNPDMTAEDIHECWEQLGKDKPLVQFICLPHDTILYRKKTSYN